MNSEDKHVEILDKPAQIVNYDPVSNKVVTSAGESSTSAPTKRTVRRKATGFIRAPVQMSDEDEDEKDKNVMQTEEPEKKGFYSSVSALPLDDQTSKSAPDVGSPSSSSSRGDSKIPRRHASFSHGEDIASGSASALTDMHRRVMRQPTGILHTDPDQHDKVGGKRGSPKIKLGVAPSDSSIDMMAPDAQATRVIGDESESAPARKGMGLPWLQKFVCGGGCMPNRAR